MLARWEAQADDLMSFTKTSIVGVKTGIYSNDRSMLLEQVIDGFKVKVNLEHKTAILRVPEVVKIWLETASPARFRSYGVKTLQVTVTDTSDEVLETAVALWDPQGEAPYNNLENCLKAGEALK
jgi:hypothetical protein